ncbi:MAG: hypothetical protein RL186_1075 [Pseudomonadota bacterium]
MGPSDAQERTFVARIGPHWRPYLQLSRFDRPIGFYLLALPCFMGQGLGRAGVGFGPYDLLWAALWIIGSVAMRGAGCSFNDLIDRDIDARVARTAGRPLPAGLISPKQALIWTLAQCGIGFLVLLALPRPAQIVALCAIPMVAAYPFMKRITWWPQVWLGLTFNWGALVGYATATGSLNGSALLLYLGCVCWTIGYDTIYAQQDLEDDALVGVKSTARLFGARARDWVAGLYGVAFVLVALAAVLQAKGAAHGFFGLCAALAFGWHLRGQVRAIPVSGPNQGLAPDPLALFRSNKGAGLILVAGFVVYALVGWALSLEVLS